MKFARYLEENAVVEWRKVYINYRGLKKVIKLVDARHKARMSKDLSRQSSRSYLRKPGSSSFNGLRKRPSAQSDSKYSDSDRLTSNTPRYDYGGTTRHNEDDEDDDDDLPTVKLDGTGLALISLDYDFQRDSADSELTKVSSSEEGSGSSGFKSDAKADKDVEASALSVPASGSRNTEMNKKGDVASLSGALQAGNAQMDGGNGEVKVRKKSKKKGELQLFNLVFHTIGPHIQPSIPFSSQVGKLRHNHPGKLRLAGEALLWCS
jgi:hypothetical protein